MTQRHQALLDAEIRQLVVLVGTYGPLTRTALARLAHAERWREGCFDDAVRVAIAHGQLRQLAFDFLARPRPDLAPPAPDASAAATTPTTRHWSGRR